MLFFIAPDEKIADYTECYKICINPGHFLNSYLYINKTGGNTTEPVEGKRNGKAQNATPQNQGSRKPTGPKIQTCRALQRFSVLIMSGFFLKQFMELPDKHLSAGLHVCKMINSMIQVVFPKKGINNIMHALGYEIAMRNWIKESTGDLQLRESKPRAKKNGGETQAQILQIDNNLRNVQKSLESQIGELKVRLQDAEKKIKDLQGQQRGWQSMQQWFTMHRGYLQSLMYSAEGKNSDDENSLQHEKNTSGHETEDSNDGDGLENENHDADNSVQHEKNTEGDELSEGNDDESEDLNDGDGQEKENHNREIHDNGEDGEAEGEDHQKLLFESSDEEQVEEFDNRSE